MTKDLRSLTRIELALEFAAIGQKPYRAAQVFAWVFQKRAVSFDEMTNLPLALRDRLKDVFHIRVPELLFIKDSKDKTRKFLTRLDDGEKIESVIIPEEGRTTLCISTQAGCALGCKFCLTGQKGFRRNLTTSELVGQVFSAADVTGELPTNVVLMGMGEPLLNCDNVIRLANLLVDQKGFAIPPRKVTISTSGYVPGIERLGRETDVNLAVSVNATTDEVRSSLMPINDKYPLSELMRALREYPLKGKRRTVTIEYVLIKGLNDSRDDARRLSLLLEGIRCKVNLIPFNPFPGSAFKRPDEASVMAFGRLLLDAGQTVVIRYSKGADIQAACGQLHADHA